MSTRERMIVPGVVVIALLVSGGCGSGSPGGASPAGPTAASSTTSRPSASTTPPDPSATPDPSAPSPPVAATTPGRAVEVPYPAGSALAVVGVAHDDVLNVRQGPSTTFPVVATLGPQAHGVVTTGRGWRPTGAGSWWIEVTTGGVSGWASLTFLAGRDGTDDVTAEVIRKLGHRPVAETMLALGREVAGAQAYNDSEIRSVIVVSVAPTAGDLGEVSYDVVGLADDSVKAERLHVFGQPLDSGEGFSLKSVEATLFCARGTPAGGLCP